MRHSSRLSLKGNSDIGVDTVGERLKKHRSEPLEVEDFMADLAFLTEAVYLSVNVHMVD